MATKKKTAPKKTSTTDGLQRLRVAAAFEFVMSADHPTVEGLRRDERFREVPLRTLRVWSADDEWQKHRDELFVEVTKRLEDKLGEKLLSVRRQNVDHIISIIETAQMRMLTAETKSWEGAAKVVLSATKDLEEIRRLSMEDNDRGSRSDAGIIPIVNDMHPEEIAAASRAIHDVRRARMKQLAIDHERGSKTIN